VGTRVLVSTATPFTRFRRCMTPTDGSFAQMFGDVWGMDRPPTTTLFSRQPCIQASKFTQPVGAQQARATSQPISAPGYRNFFPPTRSGSSAGCGWRGCDG
jgi:hypothetical protein